MASSTLDLRDLIPLATLHTHLPPRADGRPWAASSCYRWAGCGVQGRRLPTVVIGAVKYVKPADLATFVGIVPPTPASFTKTRRAQLARVDRDLAAMGLDTTDTD